MLGTRVVEDPMTIGVLAAAALAMGAAVAEIIDQQSEEDRAKVKSLVLGLNERCVTPQRPGSSASTLGGWKLIMFGSVRSGFPKGSEFVPMK
jgi:hypothetical protein